MANPATKGFPLLSGLKNTKFIRLREVTKICQAERSRSPRKENPFHFCHFDKGEIALVTRQRFVRLSNPDTSRETPQRESITLCHFEVREIFASSSTKINDLNNGISCEDFSFVEMTRLGIFNELIPKLQDFTKKQIVPLELFGKRAFGSTNIVGMDFNPSKIDVFNKNGCESLR